jgi:hypothetical protein
VKRPWRIVVEKHRATLRRVDEPVLASAGLERDELRFRAPEELLSAVVVASVPGQRVDDHVATAAVDDLAPGFDS